jgi:hypothetical protein
MSIENINPNRGLISRPLPKGGPLISMARDEPGIYFDASGNKVSDTIAAEARFDVAGDRAIRAKNEAKAEAVAKIERQFSDDKREIDGMSDEDMVDAGMIAESPLDTSTSEVDSGQPFVTKTKSGEPRVARTVQDGPVKVMEYVAGENAWRVYNRDTEEEIEGGLEKEDATELLLAED